MSSRGQAWALAFLLVAVLLFLLIVETARGATPAQLIRGFQCIHRHEASSWSTNSGNGYYGGLQMDWAFMAAYGPEFLRAWGPAHNWPPSIQIAVAVRAYLSGRGFGPWPNTRRVCGL
jgi:hypothetical protein